MWAAGDGVPEALHLHGRCRWCVCGVMLSESDAQGGASPTPCGFNGGKGGIKVLAAECGVLRGITNGRVLMWEALVRVEVLVWVASVGAAAPSCGCQVRAQGSLFPSMPFNSDNRGQKKNPQPKPQTFKSQTLLKAWLNSKRFKSPNLIILLPTWRNPSDVVGLQRLPWKLLSPNTLELQTFVIGMGGTVSDETICNHGEACIFPANDYT